MPEIDQRIEQLQARIDNLVKYQEYFYREISLLNQEITQLRAGERKPQVTPPRQQQPSQTAPTPEKASAHEVPPRKTPITPRPEPARKRETSAPRADAFQNSFSTLSESSGFEKFIGQNLLSIAGILILILGIGIGAKYAIDNNLISPAMRIVFGYVAGLALLAVALYLKEKYLNFSAVLISGAMAVLYFITFFAYSLYALFSQTATFGMMLVLTAVTVFWALSYGKQVIAHIGLVGAYAIPFMLGGESGNYAFLFTYIAIINFGILLISVRRYWKWLFYNAFAFTWVIYLAWFAMKFQPGVNSGLATLFLSIFFLMFYLTFIVHKVVFKENIAAENVCLILANSFIFYGFGYAILKRRGLDEYLGLFTLGNAVIHFAFALAVSRLKKLPQDIPLLLAALVLIFVTIAVPVQLNGNWLTLVWTMEAALLFWIGRTKEIRLFEIFSYPVMAFAAFSFIKDLGEAVRPSFEILQGQQPFLHGMFITSILFATAFALVYYINGREDYDPAVSDDLRSALGYVSIGIALLVLYNAFRMEIDNHFTYQIYKTAVPSISPDIYSSGKEDVDLQIFNIIWQMNYTMFFLSLLGIVNLRRLKNAELAVLNLALNILLLAAFFTAGVYLFALLQESYLRPEIAGGFQHDSFHIGIRYVSYLFAAILFFVTYRYTKQDYLRHFDADGALDAFFDILLSVALLILFSTEMLHWMRIGGYQDSNKLALSILWGIYALTLIVLGIYQKKKHLRVGAIALFAFTLAKVFFYDIADLSTIAKTIVFVSLGVLLLIISFLYNKYKAFIFPDETDQAE